MSYQSIMKCMYHLMYDFVYALLMVITSRQVHASEIMEYNNPELVPHILSILMKMDSSKGSLIER